MSIIAKLRTWPESGGPLTHDEAREIIRGTADLHRAVREGQDAWHLLAARNEATIQGARQSERELCDLKEVNLRIHSLLATMGYEGSTEKMVDQLVSDAVARKAERDDSRQIAQNLLDEKRKALAERAHASAEFEAGLKLMHEHMRQRDEMKTKLAAQSAMVAKLADYLETATGIIEEDAAGDEDDIADARNLISEARALAGASP